MNPLVATYRTKDGRHIQLVFLEADRYWPDSASSSTGRPRRRPPLRRPRGRAARTPRRVSPRSTRCSPPGPSTSGRSCSRRSTPRGRPFRPSRSCSTTRRCWPTTTSARSSSRTAPLPTAHRAGAVRRAATRPAAGARARRAHRGDPARARLLWDDIAELARTRASSRDDGATGAGARRAARRRSGRRRARHVLTRRPLRAAAARSTHPARRRVPALRRHRPGFGSSRSAVAARAVVDGRAPVVPARFDDDCRSCSSTSNSTSRPTSASIGRLLDGPMRRSHLGDEYGRLRGPRRWRRRSRLRAGRDVTGASRPATRWPSSATRHSTIERHATGRSAPSPSTPPARRSPTPVSGRRRSTASSAEHAVPDRGRPRAVDGVSTVTPTGWPQHSRRQRRATSRVPRLRPAPWLGRRWPSTPSSAAPPTTSLVHRALHNPRGQLPRHAMREARGAAQWTAPQGFFGPLAMIALPYNEYLQRFGATREAMAPSWSRPARTAPGSRGRTGTTGR